MKWQIAAKQIVQADVSLILNTSWEQHDTNKCKQEFQQAVACWCNLFISILQASVDNDFASSSYTAYL